VIARSGSAAELTHLGVLDRHLLFVTGKGGVGKTSTAAALAELAASMGKRTLVCEMDAKGALASAFDVAALQFEPTEVSPQLHAMEMNTEDSLREYLRLFVRIPFVGRIGPLAHTFDFVADAAPGVKEILAVGKLCYEVRERNYDIVIVDAEASGHIVAQIGAPRAIRQLVQVGLVRDQTNWMIDILDDPARTGLVIVTTPEEMPVTESLELVQRVRRDTGVDIAAVFANRVLPALFSEREHEVFERLTAGAARQTLIDAAGASVATVLEASAQVEARRRVGAGHLDRLRGELAAAGRRDGASGSIPIVIVPELFTRATGRRVVTLMAQAISDELL
jgi:anion-transporting  ArsA/GET3 family ATPase